VHIQTHKHKVQCATRACGVMDKEVEGKTMLPRPV
jgi:hypothetical protein